jgi:hypothetical protein
VVDFLEMLKEDRATPNYLLRGQAVDTSIYA